MNSITVNAPTKINLRLKVTGRREDGYHYLSMLNEKLALSDTITVEAGEVRPGRDFGVEIECYDCSMNASPSPKPSPQGGEGVRMPELENESNLVVKAARKLAAAHNVSSDLKITIEKRIPMGGGLGGGSSDAAAVMIALNRLWGLDRPQEELAQLGVTIGADLPFFFYPGPAHVTGIGEKVRPGIKLPKLWVMLANPGIHVATKHVYESLDLKLTGNIEDDSFPPIFKDLGDLAKVVENDLESVVRKEHPAIDLIKKRLRECGARIVFMSGSGSTVVGIFENKNSRDLALCDSRNRSWKLFSTENAAEV